MRIAIVCPYAWDRPGGVQTHIRSLASKLRTRDHEVLVVAPHSSSGETETGVALVGRSVSIPANGSVAPLTFGPAAAMKLPKVLERFRPDVLHLHEPLIPSLSLMALLRSDAPSVGTFHAAADGSFGYRIAAPILKAAARRLEVRTAVSDAARALIQKYLPGDYHLTPNGIDVSLYADGAPADVGPGRKVLFLGRIEKRKGLDVLIQAMTRLQGSDVQLLVAGSGPQERELRSLAARLLIDARFFGRVDDAMKAALFRRANVYCAPALRGESFGIVLIEAMAAGTPIVCSDLPGFRAVASTAAVLVTPGDPGLLADAIQRVLADDSLVARMGKAGSLVASGFDWTRLVGNVESLYERALKENIRA
jgi:phosphatidylinositol alpha-mannosyltransferase